MDAPLTQHPKQGRSLFSFPPSPSSADSDSSTLPSEAPLPFRGKWLPTQLGRERLEGQCCSHVEQGRQGGSLFGDPQ